MSEIDYLDLEDLLGLVRRLGVGPVRDVGLLDAAGRSEFTLDAGTRLLTLRNREPGTRIRSLTIVHIDHLENLK